MTIEFRCSQCNQLLRVPETAAGKNARCPKCQALMLVPAHSSSETSPPPVTGSAGLGPEGFGGTAPIASDPFAPMAAGGAGGSASLPPGAPPKHPFGDIPGASPFGGPAANISPYASPAAAGMQPIGYQVMPINPRPVAADAVFNYAWEIWKNNLGLMIGVTVLFLTANYAIAIPFAAAQAIL